MQKLRSLWRSVLSWQGDNSNIKKKNRECAREEIQSGRTFPVMFKLCLRLGRLDMGYNDPEKKVINENLHEMVVVGNKRTQNTQEVFWRQSVRVGHC